MTTRPARHLNHFAAQALVDLVTGNALIDGAPLGDLYRAQIALNLYDDADIKHVAPDYQGSNASGYTNKVFFAVLDLVKSEDVPLDIRRELAAHVTPGAVVSDAPAAL